MVGSGTRAILSVGALHGRSLAYDTQRCFLIPPWGRRRPVLTSSFAHKVRTSPSSATEAEIAALRQAYDSGIPYVDEQLGLLLKDIQSEGLAEQTWIIATADHGEEFGEHGKFFHNPRLCQEQIRVPLIISSPGGIPAPRHIQVQVQHLDIAPTILDTLGLPEEEMHRGISILPLLASPDTGS